MALLAIVMLAAMPAAATEGSIRLLALGDSLTAGYGLPIDESFTVQLEAALRDRGVPIAVASDCNPGTAPFCSLRTAMMLASRLFALTPLECLAGTTREAARALGLSKDRGTLEVGKRADIAIWDIGHPRELTYWTGTPQLCELLLAD